MDEVLNATAVLQVVPVGAGPVSLLYDGVDRALYDVNYLSNNVTVLTVPSSSGGGGHGLPPWEWGGLVGVLVAILLGVLVVLLLRRRKRKPAAATAPAAGASSPSGSGAPGPVPPPAGPLG